jgi:hypothetical protein
MNGGNVQTGLAWILKLVRSASFGTPLLRADSYYLGVKEFDSWPAI